MRPQTYRVIRGHGGISVPAGAKLYARYTNDREGVFLVRSNKAVVVHRGVARTWITTRRSRAVSRFREQMTEIKQEVMA